mmetsp:Transcript_115816/g.327630  ORF Transcript_115816/g.327630 Transcript_115816/m.327630 type:complete len:314 (+) Transcript_115816:70-1011(+)
MASAAFVTPVLGCENDAFGRVLSYLVAQDLVRSIPTSRVWESVASADSVWAEQCAQLWADKVYIPERFQDGNLQRIAAFWGSIHDASRTAITKEELVAFSWYSRMKGWAGFGWTEDDPWWNGQPATVRRYHADGTTSGGRGSGIWGFVPASCGRTGPEGSFVRHARGDQEFPTHFVARWKNWGWILQNCWGFSASFPLPPLGEEPGLEDEGDLCQRVTVETCGEEATLFNLGQPLPHSILPLGTEEVSGPGVQMVRVMLNGRAVALPYGLVRMLVAQHGLLAQDAEAGQGNGEEESENAEVENSEGEESDGDA